MDVSVFRDASRVLAKGVRAHSHGQLSPREHEVMLRLAEGEQINEIAKAMFLSPSTISTYRARVLQKLKLKNDAQLAVFVFLKNRAEEAGQ